VSPAQSSKLRATKGKRLADRIHQRRRARGEHSDHCHRRYFSPEHIEPLKAAGAYGIATIRGAGWEPQPDRHHTDPSPGKTRLVGAVGAPAGETIIAIFQPMIGAPKAAGKITLTVNGAPREIPRDSTMAELLGSLRIDPRLVVIEHNRTILATATNTRRTSLASGDVVEIVHFVGGG
jgi:thiamine biosynthesis protein ThiS